MSAGCPEPCERRRGCLPTVVSLIRVKPSLKLGILLLVITFSLTIYMMMDETKVVSSSDLPPMEMDYQRPAYLMQAADVPGTQVVIGGRQETSFTGTDINQSVDIVEELNEKLTDLVPQNDGLVPVEAPENANESTTARPTTTTLSSIKRVLMSYKRKGTVPVSCENDELEETGLLDWELPKFLPNYRNPCWYEKIEGDPDDLYKTNSYSNYSTICKKMFEAVHDYWQKKDFTTPQYRLRCLPYFLLAGQPKCGSTDLYSKLISHPDIAAPPVKEPHWWGKLRFGPIPFEDYVDLFDNASMKVESMTEGKNDSSSYHPAIIGDFSVSTLWSNDGWWQYTENCGLTEPRYTSANYIHRLLPQVKLLVILRNPTDRLYSDFLYFQKSLKTQKAFHSEVTKSINGFKKCVNEFSLRSCLYNYTVSSTSRVRLRVGMYALFLEEWMELFPRDQFLVLRLEDYSETPLASLRQVHKFLDLRTLTTDESKKLLAKPKANTRREQDKKLGGMLQKTRVLLENFYRPFNKKLAHILGDKRFLWEST